LAGDARHSLGVAMTYTRLLTTLIATVCLLALGASTASGFFKVTSSKYPATLVAKSTGSLVLTFEGASLTCETAKGGGTVGREGSQQSIYNGSVSNCKMLEAPAKVTNTGCILDFNQAKGATTGTLSIECEAGESIGIETLGCKIKIGPQNNLSSITYTNLETKPKKLEVKGAVKGITYTAEGCGIKSGKTGEAKDTGTGEGTGAEGLEVV
jgi:hypothetical protein